jgi:hypothetical protein
MFKERLEKADHRRGSGGGIGRGVSKGETRLAESSSNGVTGSPPKCVEGFLACVCLAHFWGAETSIVVLLDAVFSISITHAGAFKISDDESGADFGAPEWSTKV